MIFVKEASMSRLGHLNYVSILDDGPTVVDLDLLEKPASINVLNTAQCTVNVPSIREIACLNI